MVKTFINYTFWTLTTILNYYMHWNLLLNGKPILTVSLNYFFNLYLSHMDIYWKCVHLSDKCIDGKNIYKPGDDFVMPDCSGYCKCHPGGGIGCVSLCPPEGITCQQNEDRMQSLRKIPNSNCTCPTWSCLKKGNQGI